MKQKITVLGSTGSIGTNTLNVLSRHPQDYEVFALTAATQVDLLLEQCARFSPRYAVMTSAPHAAVLQEKIKKNSLRTEVLLMDGALGWVASHPEVDVVMGAIVGAAGLSPCLAAAKAGKRLLLANKEALVVGGQLFMDAVRDGGATLLPIDSEHSAIFQCLPMERASWSRRVKSIILTASGGPFRQRSPETLSGITPEEACAHPNFSMGRKISVDSATMMNKALEVIEARWLFDLLPDQIRVVIHPQQIIHSMVEFNDSSVLSQMGTPDMRVPIACGLSWPERIESGAPALDFNRLQGLTFEEADVHRFPGLHLSWQALKAPNGTTTVLNAANEVAVAAFLNRQLRFDQIHALNQEILSAVCPQQTDSVDALMELDIQARQQAGAMVNRWSA